MTALRPRYARIQREVSNLLLKAGVTGPAVPVDAIAEMLNAQVIYNNFQNQISGMLIRKEDNAVIGVDIGQAPNRQRFTIAHELGHLLLHDGEEVHVDREFRVNLRSPTSSAAISVEEIEANAFAANLLMPEKFIRSDVNEFAFDFEDQSQIQEMAERYKVSNQAMTFRLVNLFGTDR